MPQLARRDVDEPLAEEIGLEPARPPVGAGRRLVGHQQRHFDVNVRNAVGPRHHLGDVARGGRPDGAQIGAQIREGAAAQAQDGAVAGAGDLQLALGVAGVVGGQQVLAPILDPFDRPSGEPGRERNQEILRIEFAARPEAAAHVIFQHANGRAPARPASWPACAGWGTAPWRRRRRSSAPWRHPTRPAIRAAPWAPPSAAAP